MTNFEAISARLYPYSVDSDLIEVSCIDAGLESDAPYTSGQKTEVAMVVISILRNMVALSSESNGGYGLSYDTDKLKERIRLIAKDYGLTDIADEFNTSPSIEFLDI